MARCLISFGANLGVPAVTIRQAVQHIQELLGSRLVSLELSRLMRTPAVGGPTGQPPFVNAVAALQVNDCSAWDVWHVVRQVEQALGRVRQERWEARRIDLDVLIFDDQRIWTPQFKLPHPRMIMRRFILQPALDVAADWREPVSNWTIAQLAQALSAAPASIAVFSHQPARDERLLEAAARTAQSEWIGLRCDPIPSTSSLEASQPERETPGGRWLGLLPLSELQTGQALAVQPVPRQVFVLTPPATVTDAAWEDLNRSVARWMGLCPTPAGLRESPGLPQSGLLWPLNGPRYMLSTDDMAWAQHEIIAAMDAMDCPVEPFNT